MLCNCELLSLIQSARLSLVSNIFGNLSLKPMSHFFVTLGLRPQSPRHGILALECVVDFGELWGVNEIHMSYNAYRHISIYRLDFVSYQIEIFRDVGTAGDFEHVLYLFWNAQNYQPIASIWGTVRRESVEPLSFLWMEGYCCTCSFVMLYVFGLVSDHNVRNQHNSQSQLNQFERITTVWGVSLVFQIAWDV